MEKGEEVGGGGAEGSSAIPDRGQAAMSLTPDVDSMGSGSLLDSILSALLKKQPRGDCGAALFLSSQMTRQNWIAL